MAIEVTGTVTSVDSRRWKAKFVREVANKEFYERKFVIALDTSQGPYWFYTPSGMEIVTKAPVFRRDFKSNKWFENGECTILVGDRLKISGSLKREGTKYGTHLNRVRLKEREPAQNV